MDEIFDNPTRCANMTGTPLKLLRAAKNYPGVQGFNTSSGSARVNWTLLKPWLEAHREELEAQVKECSVDSLKKERLILDNHLKRLEIKKKENQYVDPSEWFQFFADFGSEISIKLKKTRKDLMEQCQGYEGVIDAAFLELFTAVKAREEKCRPK